MRALFFIVVVFATNAVCATETAEADAVTADAVEAGTSCVVIHEKSSAGGEKSVTCFENVALARTSFESGVCQWKTDGQANAEIKTITKFVEFCPASYSAHCDRLVLGPDATAPVKIFLYDKSDDVLARAKKQCLSGGGRWTLEDEEGE